MNELILKGTPTHNSQPLRTTCSTGTTLNATLSAPASAAIASAATAIMLPLLGCQLSS